jgi:ankyrin repeat protein
VCAVTERELKRLVAGVLLMVAGCSAPARGTRVGEVFSSAAQRHLLEVARAGRLDQVRSLVASGTDLDREGEAGLTPLQWACLSLEKTAYRTLLEAGANPNKGGPAEYSPMACAAGVKDTGYLELALQHGGDPNLVDPDTGETPIYQSLRNFRVDNARLLIRAGANLDIQNKMLGNTPLAVAAVSSRYDLVLEMLQHGANPSVTDWSGHTLLSTIRNGYISPGMPAVEWRRQVIEYLRARGLDVEHGR